MYIFSIIAYSNKRSLQKENPFKSQIKNYTTIALVKLSRKVVDIGVTMHHKATKYISKSRYDSVTQCQKRALSTILDRGDGRSVESQSRESGEQTSSYEFSQVRDIVINRPTLL